jgi:uroporphyrinogen decarboxylase
MYPQIDDQLIKRKMTHRQRLEALLGDHKTDRIPVALWRHFPVDDQEPEALARATSNFQDQFDFDLIKITPSSSFQMMDDWKGNPEGTREYTQRVIQQPDDWLKLKPNSPKKGYLADQLHCATLLASVHGASTPVLQTVFSPLAQAKNLAGNDRLLAHMRQYPEAVLKALDVLTITTIAFIEALVNAKVDGIFYAVQHAQFSLLTVEEFNRFGKAFDLRALEAAKPFWCNLLHVHGENIQFDQVRDYPVQIYNWHDQSTPPRLDQALKLVNGIVCGGLKQWATLVLGDPRQVLNEARSAIKQTSGKRLLLGTGCVTPITAPFGNILAARNSVEG